MRWFLHGLFFLLLGCSSVFYQPSRQQFIDPARFQLAYQDVWFTAKDGIKLHGWFFPAQGKLSAVKGTVVQFHGNAENISTHFMSLVWLTTAGYNLFTFDYRGYGKSEGRATQEGTYLDALAAIAQAKEFHDQHGKGHFIIYGQSTGGIISLRALVDAPQASMVTLFVQDASYASYQKIAFEKLKSSWVLFPFSPLAFLLISDEYAAEKILEKIHQPTLVIAGKNDRVIPAHFGKKIYRGINSDQKWWWKLPEGGHIDTFHHDQGRWRKNFLELLDRLSTK